MATREEIIRDCSEDLIILEKVISPQTFYLPTPDFHYEVTGAMHDRSIIQLLVDAPRGTAKSTHVKGISIDHCLHDEGDKLIVIQSKTRPEAINRLSAIKEIFAYSQAFIELYGYAGEQVAEMWREDKIKVKIKNPLTGNVWNVTIKALGTGQQVRGALEGDTRITLYILDDPEDEDNTKTKEAMEDNFSKFLGGVAGLDKRNGRVIVVGTPIRGGCLIDKLRNATGWTTLHYKNTIDKDKGIYLWKEMYSPEWLANKKKELEELGQRRKYYSEYEGEITGEEDQLFKEEDFRFYDGYVEVVLGEAFLVLKSLNKIELPTPKRITVNTFMGVDPASSTKQTADYSVTMPIAYDADKNIYVLPYYRKRVSPIDHAEDIISKIKLYAPKRGQVETTGYQEFLRNYLRMRQEEENVYLPGLEHKYNPRSEKSARLEEMQPYFFQHKIFVLEDMSELIGEAIMYPRSKHDDCIKEDALIKTIDGYKEVKDVKVGDEVLTHLGRYKKVQKVMKKPFIGKFCTLKPTGQLSLEISTNHKIYYASQFYSKDGDEKYYSGYEKRGWVEAENFKKAYKNIFVVEVLSPNSLFEYKLEKSKNSSNEKLNSLVLDKDFAKILGYFLAEGCAYSGKGKGARFNINFASHTREYGKRGFVKKYFMQFGISIKENIDGNSATLSFDNKFFHHLFAQCYDNHKEKILPSYAKHLGQDLKHTLIWWMAGDGWTIKNKAFWKGHCIRVADRFCGSTSPKLALTMRDIAFSCGYYAVIRKLKRHRYGKPTKDFYQIDLRFKKPNFSKITDLSLTERGSCVKVKDICEYQGDVYDLQVEDDHSFVCNGFVIHNCLDGLYYATRKLYPPDHMVQNEKNKKNYRQDEKISEEYSWMAA